MPAPVELIPCSEDFLETAAERIIEWHRDVLPDLTTCRILLPDLNSAPALRRALLNTAARAGYPALLGPRITTPDTWLAERVPLARPVLTQSARELVLVEAMRDAMHLFHDQDPWLLTSELLGLFSELTLAQTPLESFDRFHDRLRDSYGIAGEPPAPFSKEARIVFTLWQAWQEELHTGGLLDPPVAQIQRLSQSLASIDPNNTLWLLGFTDLSVPQLDWLKRLLDKDAAKLLLQGSADADGYHPDTPLSRMIRQLDCEPVRPEVTPSATRLFLDTLFDTGAPLQQRATQFARQYPESPLRGQLRILQAQSAEEEARAVALQVRRWLVDGLDCIGILTEDRRLARRVRALLERAGINLQDAGGWALSTTSTAAVLERWLESVEEDFAHHALLDVLKSPFVCLQGEDRQQHLHTVRRFEQDIILHENIARGLDRYRKHLALRASRLPEWGEDTRKAIEQLLNRLDHAAEPLRGLLHGDHHTAAYTAALQNSLAELGIDRRFEADPAGQRLLDEIQTLHTTAQASELHMNWQAFRGWLGRTLERFTFQPPAAQHNVQLMTLAQSALQRFDAVVIAGCSTDQLPGKPAGQAFFNQAVRCELGLSTWQDSLYLKLHHFRRALESAPAVLLSGCREQDGEPVSPTPWLEMLETFHRLAYSDSLQDHELSALRRALQGEREAMTADRTATALQQPSPALDGDRLPSYWTASSYQRLVDCPYRFFAADGLRLSAREEIREALQKADYGEYVHRILQAFHGPVKNLPGPWRGALTPPRRQAAIELLTTISETVFGPAMEENFLARGWLRRWLAYVPGYIDWAIDRDTHCQVQGVEQRLKRVLPDGVGFKGRIDRIDRCGQHSAVIDYKTGATPDQQAVDSGEAVQLPCYALLSDAPVTRAEYLQFENNNVVDRVRLVDSELQALSLANGQRLGSLAEAIADQQGLPAWGDPDVCRYCEFDGICRRDCWIMTDEHG